MIAIGLAAANLALASPSSSAIPPSSNTDRQAIQALLSSYTRCVTEHDEIGFRVLLVDENIPFSAVGHSAASLKSPQLRDYAGFREAVFASGHRYKQQFYNVHIAQHGPLAQVSLDFLTERVSGNPGSASGWKVLQLVKVGGRWKIASELYTF